MYTNIQEQLGNRIKKLRKIKGLSQESFAEQIDIAVNTLSSIETGKAFMTSQTLGKILEVLCNFFVCSRIIQQIIINFVFIISNSRSHNRIKCYIYE